MRGYAAPVRLYLAPYLGQVLLSELSAAHVQAMFSAVIRQHQAAGSPVTAATLHRIRATLRAALNAAIRRGLITDNPAGRAELPRTRRPRAVVWTQERVEHWQRTGEHPPAAAAGSASTGGRNGGDIAARQHGGGLGHTQGGRSAAQADAAARVPVNASRYRRLSVPARAAVYVAYTRRS